MGFLTPNVVISNPIANEIRIFHSKDKAIVNLLFFLVLLIIGAYFFVVKLHIVGVIVCLYALYSICLYIRMLFIKKPQIIINTSGIETSKTSFYYWSQITEERITGVYEGRGPRPLLRYKYPGGEAHIKVEELNIRSQDLNILLKYYRDPWDFNTK